jgi:hypothetical protein
LIYGAQDLEDKETGMLSKEYRAMGIAMIVLGAAMAIAYPLYVANDRTGWVWDYPARNFAMEHMLVAVYVTMGLFLILGARDPVRYLGFIDFVIVSGVAHASVMLYDALQLPGHVNHVHLGGDVIGLYVPSVVLAALHPKKLYIGRLLGSRA